MQMEFPSYLEKRLGFIHIDPRFDIFIRDSLSCLVDPPAVDVLFSIVGILELVPLVHAAIFQYDQDRLSLFRLHGHPPMPSALSTCYISSAAIRPSRRRSSLPTSRLHAAL